MEKTDTYSSESAKDSERLEKADTEPSSKKKLTKQIISFGLVGAMNAVVSYATYVIAITLGAHYLVASILGYVISVFNAWIWQYFVVFREGGVKGGQVWWRSLIKTYITYATTGLILNNILLFLMLDVIHIENFLEWTLQWAAIINLTTARDVAEYIAPIIVMIIAIPINFCMNKFWAFREDGRNRESASGKNGTLNDNADNA